ncbi:MAG: histidinol-phosphate transaminase [Desulfovibrionaceae bacterium]|nr:histidinol-phosphate transaminase [Desulfovibrionaceae bacterium]
MSFHIRPLVRRFRPYTPGRSIDEIREKYGLQQIVKLASNENPLGTSPLVQEVLRKKASFAFRYPQSGNPRLVEALAARHHVSPSRIVVGNGSDEIIDVLIRICMDPGVHNAVAFKPCFGIYSTQTAFHGVELRQTPLNEDFSFPWNAMLSKIDDKTSIVFVTSPDNPSGYAAKADELEQFARRLPQHCLLLVDEAYTDFAENDEEYSMIPRLHTLQNVAVLRTFSKSFGLAGLRLGYAILPEDLADLFWRVRLPFSVSILAEEAGLAALADIDFRQETLRTVREGRNVLFQGLRQLGCHVFPSLSNFLMFSLPSGGPDAAELNEELLRRGYIIRPLSSYGLPSHLRVNVGTEEENAGFLNAVREILNR